jgi:hypothetical protein
MQDDKKQSETVSHQADQNDIIVSFICKRLLLPPVAFSVNEVNVLQPSLGHHPKKGKQTNNK